MSHAHKAVLVAVAIAATLGTAGPASATNNNVEVIKHSTLSHCSSFISFGCPIHFQGEMTLFGHIFGIESTEATCLAEYEGLINETGYYRITGRVLANSVHGETNCATVAPACSGSLPWTGDSEKLGAGTIEVHIDECIDPSEIGTCSGEYVTTLTETGNFGDNETQRFQSTDFRIGASSFCEVTIDASTEDDATHPNLHILHS